MGTSKRNSGQMHLGRKSLNRNPAVWKSKKGWSTEIDVPSLFPKVSSFSTSSLVRFSPAYSLFDDHKMLKRGIYYWLYSSKDRSLLNKITTIRSHWLG